MQRKIGVVELTPQVQDWLMQALRQAPPDLPGLWDLRQAVEDLATGESTSLLLELGSGRSENSGYIQCGQLRIYPAARKVLRGDTEIALTPKEFDILLFLARNRGEVFTKEQIYQAVWESAYLMDDSNIMAFIRKLRRKIEPNPDAPEYILTIWGIGYKFSDRL